MSTLHEATTEMINAYHELNGDVDELSEKPSPLEFMRYVAKNRPFVIRGGCSDWYAVQNWNADLLEGVMGDTPIKVAVTPYGLVRTLANQLWGAIA